MKKTAPTPFVGRRTDRHRPYFRLGQGKNTVVDILARAHLEDERLGKLLDEVSYLRNDTEIVVAELKKMQAVIAAGLKTTKSFVEAMQGLSRPNGRAK